jgi:hypothetical protein
MILFLLETTYSSRMAIGEHQKLTTAFLASIKHVAKVRRRPPLGATLPPSYALGPVESRKHGRHPRTSVPGRTIDKQHYNYDDQKSCGVHTVLLIADERDRDPCNPKNQKGPSLVPEAAN